MRWREIHHAEERWLEPAGSGLYDVNNNPILAGDLILHHFTYGIVTAIRPRGGALHTGGLSYRQHDGKRRVCHNCRNTMVLMPGFCPFPLLAPTLSADELGTAVTRAIADLHALLERGSLPATDRGTTVLDRHARAKLAAEAVRLDVELERIPVRR